MIRPISDDKLDGAIHQLRGGQSLTQVLESFPADAVALHPLLTIVTQLNVLGAVEEPEPDSLLADRNDFLAHITAAQLQKSEQSRNVGPTSWVDLKERLALAIPRFRPGRADQLADASRLRPLFITLTLIVFFIIGSAGLTFAAASGSLPGSILHPVKLAIEQARLAWQADPVADASLHLRFARERVEEIIRLAAAGEVPDEATLKRLETHIAENMQLSATVPDNSLANLLEQMQGFAQQQELVLAQALEQLPGLASDPTRQQIQSRLQEAAGLLATWRQAAQTGLEDPELFRRQYGPNRLGETPQKIQEQGQGDQPVESPGKDGPSSDRPLQSGGQTPAGQPSGTPGGPGEPGSSPGCPDCNIPDDQNLNGHETGGQGSGGPDSGGQNPDSGQPGGEDDQNQNGQETGGQGSGEPDSGDPGSGDPGSGGQNPDGGETGGGDDGCSGNCDPPGEQDPGEPGSGEPGSGGQDSGSDPSGGGSGTRDG